MVDLRRTGMRCGHGGQASYTIEEDFLKNLPLYICPACMEKFSINQFKGGCPHCGNQFGRDSHWVVV